MAQGDVTVFDEFKAYMMDGDWGSTDSIRCAIVDNTTPPTKSDTTPQLTDYSEVTSAGTYTAGGEVLDDIATMVAELDGVMTFDSDTNPTWAQDVGNATDAYWAIIYNDTDAGDLAIAFVDLDGPVDMTAGDLTITWNGSGIFTLT